MPGQLFGCLLTLVFYVDTIQLGCYYVYANSFFSFFLSFSSSFFFYFFSFFAHSKSKKGPRSQKRRIAKRSLFLHLVLSTSELSSDKKKLFSLSLDCVKTPRQNLSFFFSPPCAPNRIV